MRKDKSVWFSQRATSRGEKTLKRCKTNVEADNAVLIDLDSDDSHNVIHVDVPEVLRKKSRIGTVIHIDDDDDDENSDHSPPGSREASGENLNNDASTSERVSPASNGTHNSMDKDGDECEIIQDNLSPFKFSKCKRTYSEKSSGRNRYGLGPDSDIDLCDDDLSDCEILEVSWGKVKEQWEKANTKRKCDVPYGQSGNYNETTASHPTPQKADVEDLTSNQTKDHSSPSSCNARYDGDTTASHPIPQKADVEDLTSNQTKDHSSPSSCNARYDGDMPSPLKRDVDDMFGTYSSGDPFSNLDAHSTPIRHHFDSKGINPEGDGPWPAGPSSNTHEGNTYEHEECNNIPFVAEVNCEPPEPYLFSSPRKGKQQVSHVYEFSVPKEKDLPRGTFTSHLDPSSGIEERLAQSKTNIPDESIPSYRPQHHFETNVNHGSGAFPKAFFPEPCPPMDSEHGSETGAVPVDSRREDRTVSSGIEEDNGFTQVPNRTIGKESSFCSDPRSKVHSELNMGETDLYNEKHDQVLSEDVDDGQTIHPSIINDKEKLKETDEYKRAAEEEWASRQRELQIQAEEAQRLKRLVKRKKAENMRVLDMERRQRQRVEEMREIQKKDEEDMNMKEQLRSEIRKELNQLEISCRDMATLLRCLGIEVGSGIKPLPHEVKAAYKRALLCFHPDRASGSDIRQLVEAEEKFKLISRMKEKLLVT